MTKTYYKVVSIIDDLERKKKNWVEITYYIVLLLFFLSIPIFFFSSKNIGSLMLGALIGGLCGLKQKIDEDKTELKITKQSEKGYIAEKTSDDEDKYFIRPINEISTYDSTVLDVLSIKLEENGINNKQKIEQLITEIDAKNEASKNNTTLFIELSKSFGSIFIIAPVAFIFGLLSTEAIKSLNVVKQLIESPELVTKFIQMIILIILLMLMSLLIVGATLYGLSPFINNNIFKSRSERIKVKNYLLDVMYMSYLEEDN